MSHSYDFVVIGAGVFGSWTAHYLRQSGASVALLDAYGAANSRASSGGETRIIRMGYGADELYTRWSARSLPVWRELAGRTGGELFQNTGVLWVSNDSDSYTRQVLEVLSRNGIVAEKLSAGDVAKRYPQLSFHDINGGVLEPDSGILLARLSVQELVKELAKSGVEHSIAGVIPPGGEGRLERIHTMAGDSVAAGTFIFACGPWLPKLFPGMLADHIHPTRQEVFFFGTPPGQTQFRLSHMPAWLHHSHPERPYVLPDIDNRGLKISFDRHGAEIDPDTELRVISGESIRRMRSYVREHIPALADAPVVETRVCQYENSATGDFLIDRHPQFENVWIVGGGSGHGFKHGPAVGQYVSARIFHDAPAEPRFSLQSRQTARMRTVY